MRHDWYGWYTAHGTRHATAVLPVNVPFQFPGMAQSQSQSRSQLQLQLQSGGCRAGTSMSSLWHAIWIEQVSASWGNNVGVEAFGPFLPGTDNALKTQNINTLTPSFLSGCRKQTTQHSRIHTHTHMVTQINLSGRYGGKTPCWIIQVDAISRHNARYAPPSLHSTENGNGSGNNAGTHYQRLASNPADEVAIQSHKHVQRGRKVAAKLQSMRCHWQRRQRQQQRWRFLCSARQNENENGTGRLDGTARVIPPTQRRPAPYGLPFCFPAILVPTLHSSLVARRSLFVFHLHAKFKHQHKNAIFIAQHFSTPAANIFAGFYYYNSFLFLLYFLVLLLFSFLFSLLYCCLFDSDCCCCRCWLLPYIVFI